MTSQIHSTSFFNAEKDEDYMVVVIDKDSKIARAHVWSPLTDRTGKQYIVEDFSKEWDGIVPLGIVEET